MEDFYYAGGLPVVIKKLLDKNILHANETTVNGKTIYENNKNAKCWNENVIMDFSLNNI